MQDEKWAETVIKIKNSFTVDRHETFELSEDDGFGTMEVIEFTGPVGKIKLERSVQPLVLERKSLGSKRIGSDKIIQYTYSDTEKINRFKVYQWNQVAQNWDELKMDRGEMIF